MQYESIEFAGVAEVGDVGGGVRPQRVPEAVRTHLNGTARDEMYRPGGMEFRFVADETVTVTLSSPTGTATVCPFWGPFQGFDRSHVGETPTTLTFDRPERTRGLANDVVADLAFDPRVCRIRFTPDSDPVVVHAVDGNPRPPNATETPERTYLAYGTSITHGSAATGPHLSYTGRLAACLGVDLINLGSSGSAYCERAVADYIADSEWDVATLSLSVNMLNHGFDVETFRERVEYMIETVGATGRPVVVVSLYTFYTDLQADPDPVDASRVTTFREVVRSASEAAPDDVTFVEGDDILDPDGLTVDVLHPGDEGMIQIADGLEPILRDRLSRANRDSRRTP